MEDNCSSLPFGSRPPNVRQHLEALGYYGWVVCGVGTVTTLTLVVLYVYNVIGFLRKSPPHLWRLFSWVTSMSMIMSFLALMTLVIPRAGILCDTVKQIFIPFLMVHFVDLTLNLKGGQTSALEDLMETNTPMSLCLPPCCCIGLCVPPLTYSKKKLRLIKALVYQMPLIQLAIIVLVVLLTEAEVIVRGNGPDGLFIFLNVLIILCFLAAMYSFNIITRSIAPQLTSINYQMKASLLGGGIILLKVQNFILAILAISGAIPCIGPYTSSAVMQRSIDASLTLFESFVLGVLTFIDYRKMDHQSYHHQHQSSKRMESIHL